MAADADATSGFIQEELRRRRLYEVTAVEAASWLDQACLLKDSSHRPGGPLRRLLRAGKIAGGHQDANGRWYITRVEEAAPSQDEPSRMSPGSARDLDANLEALRRSYLPDRVNVVFVGESPPAQGTFFYSADSNLFRYTREAFERAYARDFGNDQQFLEAFSNLGCYLDDLCLFPINHLPKKERSARRKAAVAGLAQRIGALDPLAILPVMKGIEGHVLRAAKQAAPDAWVLDSAWFPSHGHQQRYVTHLVVAIRELRSADIFGDLH